MTSLNASDLSKISFFVEKQKEAVIESCLYNTNIDPILKAAAEQGERSAVIFNKTRHIDPQGNHFGAKHVDEYCRTVKELFKDYNKHIFDSRGLQTVFEEGNNNLFYQFDSCKIIAKW